jgi:hypothetical protein
VTDTQTRLDAIRNADGVLWCGCLAKCGRDQPCDYHALAAELERVTAENDRLRAALSSALANEAQWWKKAQAALLPTYGPVGSLDGKGGVGW